MPWDERAGKARTSHQALGVVTYELEGIFHSIGRCVGKGEPPGWIESRGKRDEVFWEVK